MTFYPEQPVEPSSPPVISGPFEKYKYESGNGKFKVHWMTYIAGGVLFAFVSQGLKGDQSAILEGLDETLRIFAYVITILIQWIIAGVIFLAAYLEGTGNKGLGLVRIRPVDFAWGFALLLLMFATAALLSLGLTAIGLPPKGEVAFLLPQELLGKITWVFVSFTAGFCEELLFRGYIMNRVRLLLKSKSWVVPTIVSAIAFGFPHFYQGLPGFIIITALGVLFSLFYIRTKSLWPLIIAHFFLDFLAIIIPVDF